MLGCESETCTNETVLILDTHSLWAVLQKVDRNGYSFFQCEEGQEYNFVTYQHFHCSHDCMVTGITTCINTHYAEEKLHPIPLGEGKTIIHKMVLGATLHCKHCQTPLRTQAYRFCLTQGLPFHRVPDDSQNHLEEWCCTLEHARASTLATIAALEPIPQEKSI